MITDVGGHPLHSWRVLILPFLGEEELYQRYSFDQPWNGPDNRKLASEIPEVYRCPGYDHFLDHHDKSEDDDEGPTTQYVGVQGFGVTSEDRLTLARVMETCYSPVPWMAPADLSASALAAEVAELDEDSCHRMGTHLLLLDGSVHFFIHQKENAAAELDQLLRPEADDESKTASLGPLNALE